MDIESMEYKITKYVSLPSLGCKGTGTLVEKGCGRSTDGVGRGKNLRRSGRGGRDKELAQWHVLWGQRE
jgi:hypothetical protein